MNGIAVFYHCLLSSQHRHIDPDYALPLISAQMRALRESGLENAASTICVGVNGGLADAFAIACLAPAKSAVVHHGKGATTEIPTMNILREFARDHPGWAILYHHSKGISTPNQADGWRRRMENASVWGWSECVRALEAGNDACGCHWLTPEKNPGVIHTPFFGGTFFWAKSDYINTLPPLPEAKWENRYEAETWIGKGPRRPRVVDFFPGWPTPN
jgi:hypothetical protein